MPNPEEMMKLTEAQQRAVLWLDSAGEPIQAFRRTFSALAAFNLIRMGLTKLTTAIPPGEKDYRDHYSLTPLGRTIATSLRARANGGGE